MVVLVIHFKHLMLKVIVRYQKYVFFLPLLEFFVNEQCLTTDFDFNSIIVAKHLLDFQCLIA
jgi:hypothetical protein